jgi:hypothetical protein
MVDIRRDHQNPKMLRKGTEYPGLAEQVGEEKPYKI